MTQAEHLWAIGYDDMERAAQVRDEIIRLGWETHYLALLDVAVVVRHPDGSFTCNRERFPTVANLLGCTAAGFLAGLVLLAPLTGAAVGAVLGGAGTAAASNASQGLRAAHPECATTCEWSLIWRPGCGSMKAKHATRYCGVCTDTG